jgi:aminoglycoside phosphotransferase (APT) family kinase protein
MTYQWSPEQTIEPEAALKLVQEQFPELGAKAISLLGAGWDNTAYLINQEFIFRFPRRKIALPFLQTEWQMLPRLIQSLPLKIPLPEWYGRAEGKYPWPFLGYRMLPGITACYANLSEEQRCKFAKPLAQFLKRLHDTPQKMIADCPIENDNQARVDVSVLSPKIEKNLSDLKRLGLIEGIHSVQGHFRAPQADTIVHGDFYVRHLLVDDRGYLTGVIDWGDIHLGDRAIDLSIAHSFLPKEAHETFRSSYGGVDDETWALAKVRALYSSSLMALYGYHNKDVDLLREALRSILKIRFDPMDTRKPRPLGLG